MMGAKRRNSERVLCTLGAMFILAGCGAGPYGFSKYYEPLKAERGFDEKAREYTYSAVVAEPDEFQGRLIAWFGIVENMEPTADGRHLIRLSFNKHKERHLCADEANSSCRVTVNYKSTGGFSVAVTLRPEDTVPGLDKIQPGSLMRVFGKVRCRRNDEEQLQCDYDEQGGILLEGEYYRQWPARYFVTTRAAGSMRR